MRTRCFTIFRIHIVVILYCTFTEFIALLLTFLVISFDKDKEHTLWRVSKYGDFSGPYFPIFGLNTEIYWVYLSIQLKYGKIRTRKNLVFENFSHSELMIWQISFSKFSDVLTASTCAKAIGNFCSISLGVNILISFPWIVLNLALDIIEE